MQRFGTKTIPCNPEQEACDAKGKIFHPAQIEVAVEKELGQRSNRDNVIETKNMA